MIFFSFVSPYSLQISSVISQSLSKYFILNVLDNYKGHPNSVRGAIPAKFVRAFEDLNAMSSYIHSSRYVIFRTGCTFSLRTILLRHILLHYRK